MKLPVMHLLVALTAITVLAGESAAADSSDEEVIVVSPFLEITQTECPSHPREFWEAKLKLLEVGMSRKDVFAIFPPCPGASSGAVLGGFNRLCYPVDQKWSISVAFDYFTTSGPPKIGPENRLISTGELIEKKQKKDGANKPPDRTRGGAAEDSGSPPQT